MDNYSVHPGRIPLTIPTFVAGRQRIATNTGSRFNPPVALFSHALPNPIRSVEGELTAFFPIGSYESAEFCERTRAPTVRRALIELSAAGLLKAYAQTIEISDASGICNVAHGAALPVFIWKRIIGEGAADDLWLGQEVHLEGSESIGGLPTIRMTGIGFSEKFVRRVVDQGDRLPCGLPARLTV